MGIKMVAKAFFGKIGDAPTRSLKFDRGIMTRLVDQANGASNVDVHINTINIDSGPGEMHFHRYAENVYIVLEGLMEVVVEGERHLVGPDQVGFIPPGVVHTAGNAGTHGVCKVIEIYAPAGEDFHVVDKWSDGSGPGAT
jgi:mannose-6-phosphate isomerase-like protein (cupin superfamily)